MREGMLFLAPVLASLIRKPNQRTKADIWMLHAGFCLGPLCCFISWVVGTRAPVPQKFCLLQASNSTGISCRSPVLWCCSSLTAHAVFAFLSVRGVEMFGMLCMKGRSAWWKVIQALPTQHPAVPLSVLSKGHSLSFQSIEYSIHQKCSFLTSLGNVPCLFFHLESFNAHPHTQTKTLLVRKGLFGLQDPLSREWHYSQWTGPSYSN